MSLVLFIAMALAQDATRSVWDGVYTDEQASRGQGLYNQHCASCHADTLTGGEMSPPLAGGDFLANWNGLTLGELFDRIRTTMPQNKPGKLSREVNADITAFILNFNKFPAGKTELPHATEFLKEIRIESEKK
ncbi:MAG: cytochrome c [Bryobacteraceae bacterium]|jgi:mono/diheme cytochrome c family protein